jgi:hypothetical protein
LVVSNESPKEAKFQGLKRPANGDFPKSSAFLAVLALCERGMMIA